MADFSPLSNHGQKGSRKRKVLSTKVDLTPMVDLGFLLITFFIFTTSMSEPKSMKIKVLNDLHPEDSSQTAVSKTLSLILSKDNELWYYSGKSISEIKKTDYASGVRSVIKDKKKIVADKFGSENELVILIKPIYNCSYKNIVDILDEMMISGVTRYVVMDPDVKEVNTVMQ